MSRTWPGPTRARQGDRFSNGEEKIDKPMDPEYQAAGRLLLLTFRDGAAFVSVRNLGPSRVLAW